MTIATYYIAYKLLYMHAHRTQAKLLAKSTGCKGFYSLMRLPQHDRVNQTVPDAMHTIKDCIEKLVCLVTGNAIYAFNAVNRHTY